MHPSAPQKAGASTNKGPKPRDTKKNMKQKRHITASRKKHPNAKILPLAFLGPPLPPTEAVATPDVAADTSVATVLLRVRARAVPERQARLSESGEEGHTTCRYLPNTAQRHKRFLCEWHRRSPTRPLLSVHHRVFSLAPASSGSSVRPLPQRVDIGTITAITVAITAFLPCQQR